MLISKTIEFDAGHRVPNHKSKCRNPHGHRYKVEAYLAGSLVDEEDAPDEGMLMDYGILKTLLTVHVHDVLDHGFIIYHKDEELLKCFYPQQGTERAVWKTIVFPYIPTGENIARWVFEVLEKPIAEHFRGNVFLAEVRVWETPTSLAVYYGS